MIGISNIVSYIDKIGTSLAQIDKYPYYYKELYVAFTSGQ